jgi:hypothetical protein
LRSSVLMSVRGRLRLGAEVVGGGEPQSDDMDGDGAERAAGSMKAAGIVAERWWWCMR